MKESSKKEQATDVYATFILSGECRIGDVGEATTLEDITGEK